MKAVLGYRYGLLTNPLLLLAEEEMDRSTILGQLIGSGGGDKDIVERIGIDIDSAVDLGSCRIELVDSLEERKRTIDLVLT